MLSQGGVLRNSASDDLSRDNHSTSDLETARAGALMAHRPAWVGHHTGGSRLTPTVHPCSRKEGGCGWLTAQKHNKHQNMSPEFRQHGSGAKCRPKARAHSQRVACDATRKRDHVDNSPVHQCRDVNDLLHAHMQIARNARRLCQFALMLG